jgi:DNA repair protein RadA/Sms
MRGRLSSGDAGMDSVLGSGFVPGSVTAVFGPPGIGKTSLLTKIAFSMTRKTNGVVIWVTGDESKSAFRSRIGRVYDCHDIPENIEVLPGIVFLENDPTFLASSRSIKLIVVDSLPTGHSQALTAITSSSHIAHKSGRISVVVIGHMTRDGHLAGRPEARHLVDTLLVMEHVRAKPDGSWEKTKSATGWIRLECDSKSRHGDAWESAIYRMTEKGPVGISEMNR